MIDIEDFKKIELKVGEIIQVEKLLDTDLLKLIVDLGEEKKQILVKIGKFYRSEDLLNKKIIVVSNLKSKSIMGYESQGMLLAASKDNNLVLLTIDKDIQNGANIS